MGVAAAIVLVAAGLAVPAAQAKQHMLVGIQDDAMTLHGNPQFTFSTLKSLRTQIIRINLNWNEVAKRRPAHPQDPADPAYDWTVYDRAIRYAGQYGMQAMLSVRIASILRKAGFAGWVSLEMEGKEDPLVAVPKSYDVLRQAFGPRP